MTLKENDEITIELADGSLEEYRVGDMLRLVNLHEPLVAALERTLSAIDELNDITPDGETMVRECRAVLAAAKEPIEHQSEEVANA